MKLVVFSSGNKFHSEIPSVISMFEQGLSTFHLRKPRFSTKELEEYILAVPENYRNRIIIHSHHELASTHNLKGIHLSRNHRKKGISGRTKLTFNRLINRRLRYTRSCHSLKSLNEDVGKYDYVFLSPVFDSISKSKHKSGFGLNNIKNALENTRQKVYALGGIAPDNIETAMKMGFHGIAALGYIWEGDQRPIDAYENLLKTIKEVDEQLILDA